MNLYRILFAAIFLINICSAMTNKELFMAIYKKNAWHGSESRSGVGSSLSQTIEIRSLLPGLLISIGAKTVLDVGCGDFNWMKELDLSFLDLYIGIDIVPEIIEHNQKQYRNKKRFFIELDIVNDQLDNFDVILCRDVLQHLADRDIMRAINNFKNSGSTYLIASSTWVKNENYDVDSYDNNRQIQQRTTGRSRNLCISPFNFSAPLKIVYEAFEGKTLSLWLLRDLPSFSNY